MSITKKLLSVTVLMLSTNLAHADEIGIIARSLYQGDNVDTYNKATLGATFSYDTIYDKWAVTGGTYRNAKDRQSNILAMSYRARVLSVMQVGADLGIVSGFGKNRPGTSNGILPAVMPVVGVRSKKGFGGDAVVMPTVGNNQDWMIQFRVVAPL